MLAANERFLAMAPGTGTRDAAEVRRRPAELD